VTGCCECGDEPSGSCATELVSCIAHRFFFTYVILSDSELISKIILLVIS
jgi:hypothetical protein